MAATGSSQQTLKFDNLRNLNTTIGNRHADKYSMDHYQSQLISSTKNYPLFTYPHLFLIFHHHRRKKYVDDFKMAQHSDSFDDIFHFYNFEAFLRLNLFVTALMTRVASAATVVSGINSKAMQIISS